MRFEAAFSTNHAIDEIRIDVVAIADSIDHFVQTLRTLGNWDFSWTCQSRRCENRRCEILLKSVDLTGGNIHVARTIRTEIKAGNTSDNLTLFVPDGKSVMQNGKLRGEG